jgi:hypothetical protein
MRIFTVFRNEGSNMKRWLRGSVVLATAVGAWSCSGDPTDSFRGDTADITATPSSIFLNEGGESKSVIVQAIDGQGNPLAVDFDTSYGAGITVVEDTNFLPTNGAGPIQGQKQYVITSSGPASTSFIVSSGDVADTIEVRVTPVAFPGTFSNVTPALNEPVTITTAGDFRFGPGAGVVLGTDTVPISAASPDGTSLTFTPTPGFAGPPTVFGLTLPFFPGLALELPVSSDLTVGTLASLAGTDDPSTAPTVPTPEPGFSSVLFDAADFAAATDHFYQFAAPADGDYDITLNWSAGSDIDMFVCPAPGAITASCIFTAATGDQPESATFSLTTGTWYIVADDYAGDAGLSNLEITIARPAAP